MSGGVKLDLKICQGKTFTKIFRWGQSRKAYKVITAATQAAPCVITATAHGVPEGWVYQIANARGMEELNTAEDQYRQAYVLTANTIEINELDASSLNAYAGGGTLSYNLPVDLTGFTARMMIRETIEDIVPLVSLVSPTNIVVSTAANTVTVSITAVASAALPEIDGVYDLELIAPTSEVYLMAYGAVKISPEVTR
jgi:hypothetical protein